MASPNPKEVPKMILLPSLMRSSMTAAASGPSGTFSLKVVSTLSPNSASTALRPLSWAVVQPPSLVGPT